MIRPVANRMLAVCLPNFLLANFLLATFLLAVAVLPATSARAASVTLSYANFPPAITFPCVQMERWAKEVAKRTNGKVAVQTYPGSTLLGAKNMFRGVIKGQADIGCISMSYQPGVFPFSFSCNLPVGFTSATVASLTLWDLYQKYHPKEFSRVKVLTMFTSAPSHIMSKTPVRSLADLDGYEVRASGTLAKVMSKLGATPVAMPMPEVPEALQKGVIEGFVTSFEVLKDMNFAEGCRYETYMDLPVYPFAVIMNKRTWDGLDDDVKKVLDDLGREQALWTGQYMDNHVIEALQWSKEKYDIELIHLPEDQYRIAQDKIAPLVLEWQETAEDEGLPAEAILQDLEAFKAKYEKKYPQK